MADIKDKLEGHLKSIKSELLKINDDEKIIDYVKYIYEHIKTNNDYVVERKILKEIKEISKNKDDELDVRIAELKKEKKKYMQKNYPASLQCGDIIYVKFGMGIADEINNGHYGVILSQKGSMFLIAPLTSKEQKYGSNTIYYKNLGLPSANNAEEEISYVSFTQIRYVHCRRIENISGIEKGREHIDELKVKKIIENYNNIISEGKVLTDIKSNDKIKLNN